MEVLREIPFSLDVAALQQRLRIRPGSEDATEFARMVDTARRAARPKALYKESYVEHTGEDSVTLDGVTFTSRTLRMNLDGVHRVFPYVATCGRELDEMGLDGADPFRQYWLDTIKAALLSASLQYLKSHIDRTRALGKTSTMSPGAGDVGVWPIEQQRELFSLFGNVKDLIGVELTDSFLMIPNKSVSGIRFPTEVDFRSCQLCRRENCPSRSAPFDPALWESVRRGAGAEA